MFIDTHTHLFSEAFNEDRTEVVKRAVANGITQLLLPNIDVASIQPMFDLAAQFPNNCLPMVGLHPGSVDADVEKDLLIIKEILYTRKEQCVAVGEIGMDLYWDKTFVAEQKDAFRWQIKWALELNLPIVIHSRDSMQDCIDLVREQQNGKLRGIFHCFGGTVEEAKQIIDLGFLMGIGGVITYKKSGLAEVLASIPIEQLVLETDAPAMPLAGFQGQPKTPAQLSRVFAAFCQLRPEPVAEIAQQLWRNTLQVLGD